MKRSEVVILIHMQSLSAIYRTLAALQVLMRSLSALGKMRKGLHFCTSTHIPQTVPTVEDCIVSLTDTSELHVIPKESPSAYTTPGT